MPRRDLAATLTDARLQLHHAAQFATALGISYLDPKADDSHTDLGWDEALRALTSRSTVGSRGGVVLGVRPADLTVLVLHDGSVHATVPLHGLSIAAAHATIRSALESCGLEGSRYTLKRHYEVPRHRVHDGAGFDASHGEALEELGSWYSMADQELDRVVHATPDASEVRVWPHHFDIATLITLGQDRFTGVGLSPGDDYYPEPYFYVNAHPQPAADRLTAQLDGGGSWHTREWIGAVLPGSRLTSDPDAQRGQIRAFLSSAIAACRLPVNA